MRSAKSACGWPSNKRLVQPGRHRQSKRMSAHSAAYQRVDIYCSVCAISSKTIFAALSAGHKSHQHITLICSLSAAFIFPDLVRYT